MVRTILLLVFVVLALVVLILPIISPFSRQISFKEVLPALGPLALALLALEERLATRRKQKQPNRRKRRNRITPPVIAKPFRLTPSFESGLYGGLIGGGLSGLIIGVAYYIQSTSWARPLGMDIILQVFIYASLVGAIIGASSQLAIIWFRHLAVEKHYSALLFNEVCGGIWGGVIGGSLVGLLGGWFFGMRPVEPVEMKLLLGGSILGSIPLVIGVVFYEYQGRLRHVIRTLLSSLVIAPFVVGLTLILIWAEGLNLLARNMMQAIVKGAVMGFDIGFMLGLQIGLVLMLDRLWKVASESEAAPSNSFNRSAR